MVHQETYRSKSDGEEQSFLTRSYELHFNERPYLNHRCYLFLTKTTRERSRQRSDFSTLCRGFLLPREITDKDTAARFLESVEQFERIMNDSGHIRLRRLETDEITGTKERPGLVEKYLSLSLEDESAVLQDICLKPGRMRIGDKRLCLHTLSDTEDLPASSPPTCVTRGCPRTAATAASPSRRRWDCCCRATTSIHIRVH
ncbi:TraG family conjugative transposon ATPase [Parabacteroides distasonis]|uniref:TraG family conjugative transposon ATPase n=1 Tax=Parabacteroides distasonis TaxID=823 RepID=UPI001D11C1EB